MQQNHTTKPQPEQKKGHKPEPVVLPEQTSEFVGVAELPGGLVGANGEDVQRQADRLGDARTQTVQRQRMAMQIGQVQGNLHLQRVIQTVTRNGKIHSNGHNGNGNGHATETASEIDIEGLGAGG